MKSYQIGVNRVLEIDDEKVLIKDLHSSAEAVFAWCRWASFVNYIEDVEQQVKRLQGSDEFRYQQRIGGGWKVSVTSGFRCVDFRRFYLNQTGEAKPTKHGIALRLHEWETLKDIISKRLPNDVPLLSKARPCFHEDFSDWLKCVECLPFIHESA